MAVPKILIGADPEVFIVRGGAYISGHGMVPGNKHEPYKVSRGAVQVDGTALEFNIDPAEDAETFEYNISTVFGQLKGMVPLDCRLVCSPFAAYSTPVWDTIPAYAKQIGCDPDYNAWTGERNPPPNNEKPIRTASGHIHIGWTKDQDPMSDNHFADCVSATKILDYYLGIVSLTWDADTTRRSMYGSAGAFRPKPYGVEYRVLSNVWLRESSMVKWIWNQTFYAVESLFNGSSLVEKHGDYPIDIISKNENQWFRTQKGQNVLRDMGRPIPNFKA